MKYYPSFDPCTKFVWGFVDKSGRCRTCPYSPCAHSQFQSIFPTIPVSSHKSISKFFEAGQQGILQWKANSKTTSHHLSLLSLKSNFDIFNSTRTKETLHPFTIETGSDQTCSTCSPDVGKLGDLVPFESLVGITKLMKSPIVFGIDFAHSNVKLLIRRCQNCGQNCFPCGNQQSVFNHDNIHFFTYEFLHFIDLSRGNKCESFTRIAHRAAGLYKLGGNSAAAHRLTSSAGRTAMMHAYLDWRHITDPIQQSHFKCRCPDGVPIKILCDGTSIGPSRQHGVYEKMNDKPKKVKLVPYSQRIYIQDLKENERLRCLLWKYENMKICRSGFLFCDSMPVLLQIL